MNESIVFISHALGSDRSVMALKQWTPCRLISLRDVRTQGVTSAESDLRLLALSLSAFRFPSLARNGIKDTKEKDFHPS
jgi:hypothetical protein